MKRIILIGSVLGFATACLPLSNGRIWSKKRVTGKPTSNTLLAEDSSTCNVSTETQNRVQVGDQHRCVWETPDSKRRAVR